MTPNSGRFYSLFYSWAAATCRHDGYAATSPCRHFPTSARASIQSPSRACAVPDSGLLHQQPNAPKPASFASSAKRDARTPRKARAKDPAFRLPSDEQLRRAKADGPITTNQHRENDPWFERTDPVNEQMRLVMRAIPHPVTVISPVDLESRNKRTGHPETLAMTVSSLNTVTMSPRPIISFNTKVPSSTLSRIEDDGGTFLVHFLTPTNDAAAIAHECAGRFGDHKTSTSYKRALKRDPNELASQIRKQLMTDSVGLLARVKCRMFPDKCVTVHDHQILVAEVQSLEFGSEWAAGDQAFGLMYADGSYWKFDQAVHNVRVLHVEESPDRR